MVKPLREWIEKIYSRFQNHCLYRSLSLIFYSKLKSYSLVIGFKEGVNITGDVLRVSTLRVVLTHLKTNFRELRPFGSQKDF
jgi:hypothetical protein